MLKQLVVSLFVVSVCSLSHAEKLRIGVEAINFHPHYWQDTEGTFSGFAADFFDLFAANYSFQIEFVALPPSELLDALKDGRIDIKYPDNPAWGTDFKQNLNVLYSNSVVRIVEGTLVNPRRKNQGLENLKTLGTVKGFTPWIYNDLINAGSVEVLEFESLKDLTRAGIRNKIDAVFFNVVVATYFIDNLSTLPFILEFDDSLPFTASEFFASTVNRNDVLVKLNDFQKTHANEIAALKTQYEIERNLDSDLIGLPSWKINQSN